LTGLTDEEKVQRCKQQAREYSKRARERDSEMRVGLTKEVKALRFTRDVFELAPHVCMVLSADVRRTAILYANHATSSILHLKPEKILDQ
jgi:hypothetical protein